MGRIADRRRGLGGARGAFTDTAGDKVHYWRGRRGRGLGEVHGEAPAGSRAAGLPGTWDQLSLLGDAARGALSPWEQAWGPEGVWSPSLLDCPL